MAAAKGETRAAAAAGEGAATGTGGVGGTTTEKRKAPAAPPATNDHVRKSMQGNKRANTKPELLVRQRLRDAGLTGYRLQWKVPGHPDIAWPGKKVCVEVRGCFWHRCPHCQLSMPKSHVEYWALKFDRNVERDAETSAALEAMGWKVHVDLGMPAEEEGCGPDLRRAAAGAGRRTGKTAEKGRGRRGG